MSNLPPGVSGMESYFAEPLECPECGEVISEVGDCGCVDRIVEELEDKEADRADGI